MANPFISTPETYNISLSVNGKTVDYMGNISVALDTLTDVNIADPMDKQVLKYDATSSKWINDTVRGGGVSNLADCSDVSISSPSNDQILVFTTDSSLNKWTAYTISGATFNDTNKTITFSGTTSLSGLTTDITIATPVNGNLLMYASSSSKWDKPIQYQTIFFL